MECVCLFGCSTIIQYLSRSKWAIGRLEMKITTSNRAKEGIIDRLELSTPPCDLFHFMISECN